ncbi:MAG: hypothetical protein KA282_01090 [Clostridia bacterium]|nr:hypothetical protein [Clostridia bacterium]
MDTANGVEGTEIEKITKTEIYAEPESFALLLKKLRKSRLALKKPLQTVISGNCITSADGPAKQESDSEDDPRSTCGDFSVKRWPKGGERVPIPGRQLRQAASP